MRKPLSWLRFAGALFVVAGLAACGGSSSTGSPEDYPIVEPPPPQEVERTVTEPGGAVVGLRPLPTVYEVAPSPTCERSIATFHDGSEPAHRAIVIPPAPGLRAVAVSTRTTRLEWSFADLPGDCRPVHVTLLVDKGNHSASLPTKAEATVEGVTGSVEITYPDFLPPPNVASAAAYLEDGRRSRVVSVRIKRPADTPPDPPEPLPPVTAPAGAPITCQGRATVVDEPAGDVTTYDVGKPVAQVPKMTPALSRIDITTAAVQIDGRTICASLTFARAPMDDDFGVSFHLADTTERSCCATLRLRRTAGRLEVGIFSTDQSGSYQLDSTANAGAALRGATLVITGDIAEPSAWQLSARRMPEVENLAWRVSTHYSPVKYGPAFADWLPPYVPIGEKVVRHVDGTLVKAGG